MKIEVEKRIVEIYTTPNTDGTWTGAKSIAKLYGISPTTVYNILSRYGIEARNATESHSGGKRCKPIKNLPPKGDSPPFCKCGCGEPVAWNRRKNRWNVYVVGHYRLDQPYKDNGWLYHQYVSLNRTLDEIATECNVNRATIVKFMKKFGIKRRNPSLAHIGRQNGEKNPAWKGGVAKWNYSHDWKRVARTIRKRDSYTCQICKTRFPKSSKLLHVHHIDGDKFNNNPANLITVCATCHPKGNNNVAFSSDPACRAKKSITLASRIRLVKERAGRTAAHSETSPISPSCIGDSHTYWSGYPRSLLRN